MLSSSERQVMRVIREHRKLPRSMIDRHTALTQQSVHRIVGNLVSRGFLNEKQPVVNGRGKPSPIIELDTENTASMGLSVSTSGVEVIVIDLIGNVLKKDALDVDPNNVTEVTSEFARYHSYIEDELFQRNVIGLGLSIQGYRQENGFFIPPVPLDNWSKFDIAANFAAVTNLYCECENDVNCAVLASAHQHPTIEDNSIAYLAFNFGFGAGIVINNRLMTGGFGNAGEISHIFLAEQMSMRPALEGLLQMLRGGRRGINSIAELRERYDPEWPEVSQWLDLVTPQLNYAVRSIWALIDPHVIYFGGAAPSSLRKALIQRVEQPKADRHGTVRPFPALVESLIDGDASIYGAASLPILKRLY